MRIKDRTRSRLGLACAIISALLVLASVIGMLAGYGVNFHAAEAVFFGLVSVFFGFSTYRRFGRR